MRVWSVAFNELSLLSNQHPGNRLLTLGFYSTLMLLDFDHLHAQLHGIGVHEGEPLFATWIVWGRI